MNQGDYNKFIDAIRRLCNDNRRKPNNMIYGIIRKVDPIEIDIGNGIVLTKECIYLGYALRPHKIRIPHIHTINVETELNITGLDSTNVTTTATVGTGPVGQVIISDPQHKHNIVQKKSDDVHKSSSDSIKPTIGDNPNPSTDCENYVWAEMYPKLKEGDSVLIFAFNNYQKYYVAERIGGDDDA